jgi:hypothetical protein
MGLLLLVLLWLHLSRHEGSDAFRPQAESLFFPFLLFSGTYYVIFGLISRTLLSWYPFPLLPILALGQGYLLWVCLQASTRQPAKDPYRYLSLLFPPLIVSTALSHKLLHLSIPLFLLSLIYLALYARGSKEKPHLFSLTGILLLFLYFSLSSYLASKSRTYRSPDPYPEVARQVKLLGAEEVLFDADIGGSTSDKIYPLKFYLEIPVKKAQIEPYLRGKEDGGRKLILTTTDRWMALRGIATRAGSARQLPGGKLISWQLEGS